MMQDQQESASELGGLKESLAAEVSIHGSSNITPGNRSANMRLPACLPCLSAVQLQELQDEAWKLQMFSELEMLKRQLESLNQLDANLDRAEAVLEQMDDSEFNPPTQTRYCPCVRLWEKRELWLHRIHTMITS